MITGINLVETTMLKNRRVAANLESCGATPDLHRFGFTHATPNFQVHTACDGHKSKVRFCLSACIVFVSTPKFLVVSSW
jgi:hypothetical protein